MLAGVDQYFGMVGLAQSFADRSSFNELWSGTDYGNNFHDIIVFLCDRIDRIAWIFFLFSQFRDETEKTEYQWGQA
jgi:hypothetical protein